jgi:hypothetical protein
MGAARSALLLEPDNTHLHLACKMISLRDFDAAIELPGRMFPHAERQNLMWFENDTTLDPIRDDERYKA